MRNTFFSVCIGIALTLMCGTALFAQEKLVSVCYDAKAGQCSDGIDNDGDGKADRCGLANAEGVITVEPDPSCIVDRSPDDGPILETKDVSVLPEGNHPGTGIVPCTNKCSFSDVFRLANNVITFFFTVILIPLFILIIIFVGYKYITAQGNPSALKLLKSTASNIVIGLVIMLCAWLVVRVALGMILSTEFSDVFMFFE